MGLHRRRSQSGAQVPGFSSVPRGLLQPMRNRLRGAGGRARLTRQDTTFLQPMRNRLRGAGHTSYGRARSTRPPATHAQQASGCRPSGHVAPRRPVSRPCNPCATGFGVQGPVQLSEGNSNVACNPCATGFGVQVQWRLSPELREGVPATHAQQASGCRVSTAPSTAASASASCNPCATGFGVQARCPLPLHRRAAPLQPLRNGLRGAGDWDGHFHPIEEGPATPTQRASGCRRLATRLRAQSWRSCNPCATGFGVQDDYALVGGLIVGVPATPTQQASGCRPTQ